MSKLSSGSSYSLTPTIPSCIERLVTTTFEYDDAVKNQPAYTLEDLSGTESDLAGWLKMQMKPASFDIEINKEISLVGMAPLAVTTKQRPDVAIIVPSSKGRKYVQIEIESGKNRPATLKKLEIGLVDQLRYQRNLNDTVMSCSGFYFPCYRATQVVKVTVTWRNDEMNFWSSSEFVHEKVDGNPGVDDGVRRDVILAIQNVLDEEKKKILDADVQKWFTVPLSKSWVQGKFGYSAKQIYSGRSIVVADISNEKVHKFPFDSDSALVLNKFLHKKGSDRYVCLPLPFVDPTFEESFPSQELFTFKLLTTISTTEAKDKLRGLVNGIVSAVNHLHDHFKMAHLDIRLPNICFDGNGEPVLIDLDRCMHIEASAFKANKYGKSVMYSIPREIISCTVRNLDWLQVGLLICSLLDEHEESMKDYHADLPVLDGGTFLYSLVNLGEYVPDQHKTWDHLKFTR